MARNHRHGIESTAAIAGHPIHPMIVPFPIAFLVGALVTDIAFRNGGGAFWAEASFWLLLAGLVTGALAAVVGLVDFATIPEARRLQIAWGHFLGNAVALVLAAWNVALRWGDAPAGPVGLGLWLSLATVLILLVTGWLGGELAFRHRIGVSSAGSSDDLPGAREPTEGRAHRDRPGL